MGAALAQAAIDCSFDVTVVSGPVAVEYPSATTVVRVNSTEQMLESALKVWPDCVGVIAAAAPCDFRAENYSDSKIKRQGQQNITLSLVPNPDILQTLGSNKSDAQWSVGFALETENGIENAITKLKKKNCDLMVLNSPAAIDATSSQIRIIDRSGEVVKTMDGTKSESAKSIIELASRLP